LIAVCPITELEFFYSVRSPADRERGIQDLRSLFGRVPVHDRAFARAWEVQGELTGRGQHRSAGPVDLVVAATAEPHGLALLHHDRDFDIVARVTGQPVRRYGSVQPEVAGQEAVIIRPPTAPGFSADEARHQLDIAIDGGRYGELVEYDSGTGELVLGSDPARVGG
jgi:predicted nucleic acid-binding protein